ncbi:SsgA family sporulation/cell division regulator [Actinacidiphila guanduensis]|uniref:Streptomyces sporulation and cell division protein, SsgA n=1 Tax=Actinacidiphila guanduensis TaxID=310781 RepID=A0A1H0SBV7_9ACTN|nr:SsgA family sporulation/cell division regulator [Actinacidiphila guanduensis]SDP39234.1 Streptomyces sporulation and cell division protein, SsgA [Actinacidiphila guanduensis]
MECNVTVQGLRIFAGGLSAPLVCELSYSTADPLAVAIVFDVEGRWPVRWLFARDLLADGLTARTGQGDVVIWPGDEEGSLLVQVRKGHCAAHFKLPLTAVGKWLARCYGLVPRGHEMQHVDWGELQQFSQ